MPNTTSQTDMHPIKVVVRRSGVSADLLRAWEKRYQAVEPSRSSGGHRLYSDADIERLRLIKEAMAGGRRIGDVAPLPTTEIERLIADDRAEVAASPAPNFERTGAEFLPEALAAMRRADQRALRVVLSRALLVLTPERFTADVATPFMHELGALWERGELSPGHEHAASEVMRRLMHEMLGMLTPPQGAPGLVIATLSGQRHEIGALFAATAAALDGWRVTYLGSDLPASDIARVAHDVQAQAIALSITMPNPNLKSELAALRASAGPELPIIVGGQQAAAAEALGAPVSVAGDVSSFQGMLRALAASAATGSRRKAVGAR